MMEKHPSYGYATTEEIERLKNASFGMGKETLKKIGARTRGIKAAKTRAENKNK